MADVNVKNEQNTQRDQKGLQTQQRNVSRRGSWDPFSFSLIPSDIFGSDPFSLMRRFREEMNRSFGGFGGGSGSWNPAIEVTESDGQLKVCAEMPGMKPEDVKVEVTDDALVIHGERRSEHENREGGVYRSERHYGQFYRAIPLPEGSHGEQAKARFQDGVLEVTLPLPAAPKSNRRTIPIEGGAPAQKEPKKSQS